MIPKTPFNTWLMDVDEKIKTTKIREITSSSIYAASSTDFHPLGLFSEEIFGQIGTPERMERFAYIDLHTTIFQPIIFKTIISLKKIYLGIMDGTVYAKFSEEEQDLIRCDKDDPEADTGYGFFINTFPKIVFRLTGSQKRKDKIDLLNKYKDILTCNKLIVSPAGVRDIRQEDGMLAQEDINKHYLAIMSYAASLPKGTNSIIYDGVRMNVQKKALDIYNYIGNILTGKKGFLQGTYGRRAIALGTRNVISASKLNMLTPYGDEGLKYDETKCPLFQTMKSMTPLIVNRLKTMAFDYIFTPGSSRVSLIDPKTKNLVYVDVDNIELDKFRTSDGIESHINRFAAVEMREKPVAIKAKDGKYYWLYLIHDLNDEIVLFRNASDLPTNYHGEINESAIRALTWTELMYIVTFNACQGKHTFITRYPVIEIRSCFPSKIHLATTTPSRKVRLIPIPDESIVKEYPEYPILGNPYQESIGLFPSRLKGLNADFDGDTVSMNVILSEEANTQVSEYLNSIESMIDTKQKLSSGASTGRDNIQFVLYNMSKAG